MAVSPKPTSGPEIGEHFPCFSGSGLLLHQYDGSPTVSSVLGASGDILLLALYSFKFSPIACADLAFFLRSKALDIAGRVVQQCSNLPDLGDPRKVPELACSDERIVQGILGRL